MRADTGYSTINFYDQGFRVKNLTSTIEHEKAYRLRHRIFVDELKWVAPQADRLEIDVYDGKGMFPLGVFNQTGELIAHLRITLPHHSFMMEREFASLIESPISKSCSTVEVSRVCIEYGWRRVKLKTVYGEYHLSMLLYKGLYQWCCQNLINNMYMVIEYKLYRLLKMTGFSCEAIGRTIIMPDGVSAIAVKIDWRKFESVNKKQKPQLLTWFDDSRVMNQAA